MLSWAVLLQVLTRGQGFTRVTTGRDQMTPLGLYVERMLLSVSNSIWTMKSLRGKFIINLGLKCYNAILLFQQQTSIADRALVIS